ncbi:MAG: ThiF family adenylyltransferase, partial [Chloroflexota bacterium]|nr:ThiF family adenylyltransferase [Chloroflexota bacterium]
MPYRLDNAFLLDNPWITVVGCGGTGGFVAEGLCRLFQGREARIVLVDHDRVEPHNLLRQNFFAGDVGQFKSKALADRLAKAYRRPVGYSVYPFREYDERPNGPVYPGLIDYGESLIIGCADNAAAR